MPDPEQISSTDKYLAAIAGYGDGELPEPISRIEQWLKLIYENGGTGGGGGTGAAAGFGSVTATVDDGVGEPSVKVTASGPNTAKNFSFAFSNIKGEPGAPGKDGKDGEPGKSFDAESFARSFSINEEGHLILTYPKEN